MHTAHYAVATANPLATQAACEVLQGRRHRGRRAGHRTGRAGAGRAAVLRDRRRRVPALLRRQGELRAGLRRPGDRSRRGHRELPALDLRHRPHRAQARRPGVRPLHRRARHPAAADGRPPAARQDRVARPLHPRRDAGRRRLRHQPAAGRRHRRRRATAEGRPGSRRLLPQPRRQPQEPPTPNSPTRRTQRHWASSHPTRSRSTPATSPGPSSPRRPTPPAAARPA